MDLLALLLTGVCLQVFILALPSCHFLPACYTLNCAKIKKKEKENLPFIPADRRAALLISRARSHFLTRRCCRLSATSGESLMWNIRLHSCCRTPGGVAAGKFSSSVGRGNGGKEKREKWAVKPFFWTCSRWQRCWNGGSLIRFHTFSGHYHWSHRFH